MKMLIVILKGCQCCREKSRWHQTVEKLVFSIAPILVGLGLTGLF